MGRPTPETRADKSHHQDHEHFKALKDQGQFGSGDKKLIKTKQQPADAELEAYERFHGGRKPSTVFENPIRVPRPLPQKPGEQRGEAEPLQFKPAEQPEEAGRMAGQEYNSKVRELAKALSRARTDEGVTYFIERALSFYPDLPPDEALREYNRLLKGFTFQ